MQSSVLERQIFELTNAPAHQRMSMANDRTLSRSLIEPQATGRAQQLRSVQTAAQALQMALETRASDVSIPSAASSATYAHMQHERRNFQNLAPDDQDSLYQRWASLSVAPDTRISMDLILEYYAVERDLLKPLGDTAREQQVFGPVKQFVEQHGMVGVALLQDVLARSDAPTSTRYFVPALLAYIKNAAVRQICIEMLHEFRNSDDKTIRAGAEDGIEYLQSA